MIYNDQDMREAYRFGFIVGAISGGMFMFGVAILIGLYG